MQIGSVFFDVEFTENYLQEIKLMAERVQHHIVYEEKADDKNKKIVSEFTINDTCSEDRQTHTFIVSKDGIDYPKHTYIE